MTAKYTNVQVLAVAEEFKSRLTKQSITDIEFISAVIAMHNSGRIDESDAGKILLHAYAGDVNCMKTKLLQASLQLNDEMILEIQRKATH
ncbi:hypothetical protein NQ117_09450 [Paenibacillus sp. SC116]|uniref:hypothetical protein n=1 Tax=Paenibacillus sp. SC116 TaxID=2968986 RepID=UPI00215A2BDF|nr:hypothetical protein [Paenibacillus sp. SC116]MCR8843912.1 hypothetical protein [Paenibacillus sp. SC116]